MDLAAASIEVDIADVDGEVASRPVWSVLAGPRRKAARLDPAGAAPERLAMVVARAAIAARRLCGEPPAPAAGVETSVEISTSVERLLRWPHSRLAAAIAARARLAEALAGGPAKAAAVCGELDSAAGGAAADAAGAAGGVASGVAGASLLADVCALDPPLLALPAAALPVELEGGRVTLARARRWSGAPPSAGADLWALTLAAPAAAAEPGAPPAPAARPLNLHIWGREGVGYASHALERGGRRDVDLRDLHPDPHLHPELDPHPGGARAAKRAVVVRPAVGDLILEWRENPAVEARLAQLFAPFAQTAQTA